MKRIDKSPLFWFILGVVFFVPFLGGVHLFDWDENNFAEIAREMVATGDWLKMQINYEVFTEKPPLFFWLQAASMKLFGVNEFAARFPNALLGTLVLPYLYRLGRFLVDKRFGLFWALSWFGSILPFLYFKSGIIDPFFNFFIFNGILFLILSSWKDGEWDFEIRWSRLKLLIVGGAFIGLGILTKGPVAYLIVFLTYAVYAVIHKFVMPVKFLSFVKFSLSALGVFLVWFAVDLIARGPEFIIEFTIRQWELLTTGDAGHSGFFGYHFVVLLFGCFPASIFALSSLKKRKDIPTHLANFQLWMIVLFWVVLILFSLVGTKIIHYSSMAYYPITFLSALTLWRLVEKKEITRGLNIGVFAIGALVFIISFALPYVGMNPDLILPLMESDPFAQANMEAEVWWSGIDFTPAIWMAGVLAAYLLLAKKKGLIATRVLFYGTGTWVLLALIFFVAKVERISQYANVEFFEERSAEEVYVTTYGYKSYVPWFYNRPEPYQNDSATSRAWLFHGEIDKPLLISVKINKEEEFRQKFPEAVFLYSKNGFYFFERPALSK
ncbi:MAG: glycosyltransferase family 39 protein [Flavobacteriia bacterium]|nr:glycosyltransferase family 39 protein [Flavobacteriia bacterium]